MTDVVPPGQKGIANIEHFEVSESESRFSALRPQEYVPKGKYVRLYVNGRLFMSDTHMEKRTNLDVILKAHGDVLIAGLGIGMILIPILQDKRVTSVTVLELSQDVIDLVEPALRGYGPLAPHIHKLRVVQADVYTWEPPKGQKFDVIYFDIWADQSTDALKEMEKLHRRYASKLNRQNHKRWMESWRRSELKYRKRQEDRQHQQFSFFRNRSA